MSQISPITASTLAPAGVRALPRPRLFEIIDRFKNKHATWIVAAGGYGKTTLAISYAHHNTRPTLWLRIPESGASVGEFFFKLRQRCIELIGTSGSKLPILNPEYSSSLDVFVRQFAETFINCINSNSLLLIDDMHHISADDPLQSLIALFIKEIGLSVQTLITSRHEPAPAWISLRSRGQLGFIDEHLLSFNNEESTQLLTREGLPKNKISGFLPQLGPTIGGWPVALMLLLEHWQRTASIPETLHKERSLNDWFMYEIYLPLSTKDKQVLRYSSLLNLVPENCLNPAINISDASKRFERLAQEHAFIFIEPSIENGHHYRCHDLFKNFLRQQFLQEDSPEKQQAIIQSWAHTLWQEGFWELAAPLLVKHEQWDTLADGISQVALELIQTGRGDKLYSLITAIPEEKRRSLALLRLWEGVCLILIDTAAARELMASAWDELTLTQDYIHLALAWSGIVDSIWLEWAHVSLYERWINEFERYEETFRQHLPAPLWHTVLRGIVTAISYGRPLDPSLHDWEREALAALSCNTLADSERVMLASQLMYLNTWQFGRRAGASRVMAVMAHQLDVIERSSPLAQCLWKTFTALWAFIFEADKETCLAEAEIGRKLIRDYGIGTWDDAVPAVHCALAFCDEEAMDNWVSWFMRTEPKTHRPFYDTFQAHFLSAQAWVKNQLPQALSHAEESVTVADKHGSIAISALFRGIHAGLLAENGHFAEALRVAKAARLQMKHFHSDFLNVGLYLNLAKIPLYKKQPARALPYLRLAFAAGERQRLFFPAFINNNDLAQMCALMLAEDNANEYALWHIQSRQLNPPADPNLRLHWPWYARINVLGEFSLRLRGQQESVLSGGKQGTNKLLSYLIAAGPNGMAQETLAASLWPDSETDKALNSLYVTLHRLRNNLFSETTTIVNEEGRVRFNPQLVEVDAWEFLELSQKAKARSTIVLKHALRLYQGPAQLPGMDEVEADIWRLKLTSAYETIIATLANRFEKNSPKDSLALYQQGLEQCPLSIALWCGVLRCHADLGNQHLVHENYRLLSKRFDNELSMAPPRELTEQYKALALSNVP